MNKSALRCAWKKEDSKSLLNLLIAGAETGTGMVLPQQATSSQALLQTASCLCEHKRVGVLYGIRQLSETLCSYKLAFMHVPQIEFKKCLFLYE